jgi:hypothetical protein
LHTRKYEVIFPDGSIQSSLDNTIVKNLYSQVDEERQSFSILSEIIDRERDEKALTTNDSHGNARHTTKEWKLLVSWKDGTISLVPLLEMKNSYPVEMADYAIGNKLSSEPTFR